MTPCQSNPSSAQTRTNFGGGQALQQQMQQELRELKAKIASGNITECQRIYYRNRPRCLAEMEAFIPVQDRCMSFSDIEQRGRCLDASNRRLESACGNDEEAQACLAKGNSQSLGGQFSPYSSNSLNFPGYDPTGSALLQLKEDLDHKRRELLDSLQNIDEGLSESPQYRGTGDGTGWGDDSLASVKRDHTSLEDLEGEESEVSTNNNQDEAYDFPDENEQQASELAKANREPSQSEQACPTENAEARIQSLLAERDRLFATYDKSLGLIQMYEQEKEFNQQVADEGMEDANRGMVANSAKVTGAATDETIDWLAKWTEPVGGDIVKYGYQAFKSHMDTVFTLVNQELGEMDNPAAQMDVAGKGLNTLAGVTWSWSGNTKNVIGAASETTSAVGKINEGKVLDASLAGAVAGEQAGEVMLGKGNPISKKLAVASTVRNAKTAYEGVQGIRDGIADRAAIGARSQSWQQKYDAKIAEEQRKTSEYAQRLKEIQGELTCLRGF